LSCSETAYQDGDGLQPATVAGSVKAATLRRAVAHGHDR
jgi:hypothetical protein